MLCHVRSMGSYSQFRLSLHPHRVAVPFPPTFLSPWPNSLFLTTCHGRTGCSAMSNLFPSFFFQPILIRSAYSIQHFCAHHARNKHVPHTKIQKTCTAHFRSNTWTSFKVGLGISRTNADSQWNPVYNVFHRNFCGNETIRR